MGGCFDWSDPELGGAGGKKVERLSERVGLGSGYMTFDTSCRGE